MVTLSANWWWMRQQSNETVGTRQFQNKYRSKWWPIAAEVQEVNIDTKILQIYATPQVSPAHGHRQKSSDYATPQASQSFDARNLQIYATPQASPAHSHSTPEIFGFMPLHGLHSHSTPGIFGFMPLHRLHLACDGEPLSPFRSQGLLRPKYKPTLNHYKHTDPPSKL